MQFILGGVLCHEQMNKESPFSVLNIEQTSNWLGVKQALLYMYIYMMCKIIFIYTQLVHVYDVHLLRDCFVPKEQLLTHKNLFLSRFS